MDVHQDQIGLAFPGELDAILGEWTAGRVAEETMVLLQGEGIAYGEELPS